MTQKLILKNPRIVSTNGEVEVTPDLLFHQVKDIIRKELLRRNIIVDMIDINFKIFKRFDDNTKKGGIKV